MSDTDLATGWLAGRNGIRPQKIKDYDITGVFAHSYFLFGLYLKDSLKMKIRGIVKLAIVWCRIICLCNSAASAEC